MLNISVQLFLLLLLAARLSIRASINSNFAEIVFNLVITSLFLPFRPFVFLLDAPWKDLNTLKEGQVTTVVAVARGLLVALPLLIVFALLFASADAVFEGLLKKVFNFKLENIKRIAKLVIAVVGIASMTKPADNILKRNGMNGLNDGGIKCVTG